MFKLIKWALILTFFGGLFTLWTVFKGLNEDERAVLKKDALHALENEDSQILKDSITNNLIANWKKEGTSLWQKVKAGLRNLLE